MVWTREVEGIVMPPSPTFDKCAGLYFLLGILKVDLDEVPIEFIGSSNPRDRDIRRLVKKGYYPLDVGENKYHSRRFRSGFETVCFDFDLDTSFDTPMVDLLHLVGKNNRTGNLKAHKFSLVWALREAYKVERDQKLVIRKVMAFISAYLRAHNGKKVRRWDDIGNFKSLDSVMESIDYGETGFHLFTLPWLVRTRFILGDKIGEIRDEANWWLRVFNATGRAEEQTELDFVTLQEWISEEFEVCGQKSVSVESDDQRVGRLCFRRGFGVVIIKRTSGNVAVLSKKGMFDMGEVAEVLDGREPECWHFDSRIQACLNGTPSWHRDPTELHLDEISKIVQENARRKPHREPRRQLEKRGRW